MRAITSAAIALLVAACGEPATPKTPVMETDPNIVHGGSGGTVGSGGAAAQGTGGTAHAVGSGGTPAMLPMNNAGGGGSASVSGSGGTTGIAPKPEPFRASIHVPQVLAGEEGTVCLQVRLNNPQPIEIVELHNTLSRASHHFIVSQVTDADGVEEDLAPCTPFRGAVRGAPLSITQKHDDLITMPAGVAYSLGASQIMHLELHYLNTSEETIDVSAETALFAAPAGTALQEATVMLIGTGDIALEPHAVVSTGPKYLELPSEMNGVNFFAITGHTHRFGTNVTVSSTAGAEQAGTLLYAPKPFLWDAPEMTHLEPAVQVPTNGGFTFECTWNNKSDEFIGFGESGLSEMCFFWAYYYPKKPVTNVLLDGIDLGVFLGL